MSDTRPHPDATNRAQAELYCLARALIPVSADPPSHWLRKLTTAILFGVWAGLALGVAPTNPRPEFMYPLTGIVFLIMGRQWNIEADRVGIPGLSTSDDSEDK